MVLLSMEKLTLPFGRRSWPSFIHTLVPMEPEASQVRLVLLLSSIKMAAGLWMVAPVINANKTQFKENVLIKETHELIQRNRKHIKILITALWRWASLNLAKTF